MSEQSILELIRKVHLNQKIIDTKLKIKKLYSFILILIISGCDFRTPETWETPTWYLPLSIPLFNDIITLGDLIDTDGSDIQLDTITNSYSIDTSRKITGHRIPSQQSQHFH